MRIIQVTPGVMPIPPNGWGAVEKVIWEYKKSLELAGYDVDILYADDVKNQKGQIVHVHMANLANLLHERGIEYVFSLHDHHVEHFGKGSDCYLKNYEAIRNSRLTFVHSRHLIDYFERMPQMVYLPHGANLADYAFSDRSAGLRKGEPRLFMMASNGIGGDQTSDRKGFLPGIEAARKLGLAIEIICPESNRAFFDHHMPDYGRLNVRYGLGYEESIAALSGASVFLHPSNLEAGHPNLTVAESLAMGIPVVGTCNEAIKGLVRTERDPDSLASAVQDCLSRYDTLVSEMESHRHLLSWDIIVSKMLMHYKRAFRITEKEQLERAYATTVKTFREKQEKSGIHVDFKSGRAFVKTSRFTDGMNAVFKDKRTNRILYHSSIGKGPGQWAYIYAPTDRFVDWRVEVKQGATVLHREDLSLSGKRVLLEIAETWPGIEQAARAFAGKTGCHLTVKSQIRVDGCCADPLANPDEFHFCLNQSQLADFFRERQPAPDRELLALSSGALGDCIGFMPYAQKWAANQGKTVDVAVKHHGIFEQSDYPNLRIVDRKSADAYEYTDLHAFEYIFGKPLQRGYSDQFGIQYEEIRPSLRKSGAGRPIKEKYVCLGVHSTAQCKYWNYPGGWEALCHGIKEMGLVPVALDLHEVFGIEGHWNSLPDSALKKVGMDFAEVMRYIEHCEFFVGVSSGLSWVAHGLGKKVVIISGTTSEDNEFADAIRVFNKSVCNGCFNKPGLYSFNAGDWLWCPVNRGTPKQFECSKKITPEMVLAAIRKKAYGKKSHDAKFV